MAQGYKNGLDCVRLGIVFGCTNLYKTVISWGTDRGVCVCALASFRKKRKTKNIYIYWFECRMQPCPLHVKKIKTAAIITQKSCPSFIISSDILLAAVPGHFSLQKADQSGLCSLRWRHQCCTSITWHRARVSIKENNGHHPVWIVTMGNRIAAVGNLSPASPHTIPGWWQSIGKNIHAVHTHTYCLSHPRTPTSRHKHRASLGSRRAMVDSRLSSATMTPDVPTMPLGASSFIGSECYPRLSVWTYDTVFMSSLVALHLWQYRGQQQKMWLSTSTLGIHMRH